MSVPLLRCFTKDHFETVRVQHLWAALPLPLSHRQQPSSQSGNGGDVSLAAKTMASRQTEFSENIGGAKSYTVDVFRRASAAARSPRGAPT